MSRAREQKQRATSPQIISELQVGYLRAQWAQKYVMLPLTCTKKESGRLLLVNACPDLLEVKPTAKQVEGGCTRQLVHPSIRVTLTPKVSITRMEHQHAPPRVCTDGRCTISQWSKHLKGTAEETQAYLLALGICCLSKFKGTIMVPGTAQHSQLLWAQWAFAGINKHSNQKPPSLIR